MEAEHTALPMALRAAIPLLDAAQATAAGLSASGGRIAASKAALRGGSQGALALAEPPAGRGTPRPKL